MAHLLRIVQPFGKFNATGILRWQRKNIATTTNCNYDLVIVGGGIVGVAAAREIQSRHAYLKVALVEKENQLSAHQSGHSTGVIHEGLYNQPGTCNAKLCRLGSCLMYGYCEAKGIPLKKCGQLIVAANELEMPRLLELYAAGVANKVPDLQFIQGKQIELIEPACKGVSAIWSPHTSIVNFAQVVQHLATDFLRDGGDIYLNSKVTEFTENTNVCGHKYPILIQSDHIGHSIGARYVFTCAGLHADKLTNGTLEPRIVPFRAEYLCLACDQHIIRGVIGSLPPHPCLPFLGAHFIPQIDGSILLGPTAVMAFKREGYAWSDVNWLELFKTLRYSGFQKLAKKHYAYGYEELVKTVFMSQHLKAMQVYVPRISGVRRGPTGVYAQAIDKNGNLLHDFVFANDKSLGCWSNRVIHCINPPMPGASSSLAFAKIIADKVEDEFKLESISTYWAAN